jgi:signal transduction histidine kinase
MQLELKLTHKAIIGVAVLLTVELLLIGTLSSMLAESEHQLSIESHSRAVIGEIDGFVKLFYDAGAAMAAYVTMQSPLFGKRFRESSEQIPAKLQSLRLLALDYPEEQASIERIDRLASKSLAILNRAATIAQEGHGSIMLLKTLGIQEDLEGVLKELLGDLQSFEDREQQRQQTQVKQRLQIRAQLKQFVAIAVLLNVLIAVLAAVFIMRGIARRIEALVTNTKLLAEKKPLNPRVKGSDELAQLDHVFHNMADALAEAELIKNEFISVLSHELRTPLSSIQGTLHLLAAGVYVELPEKAQKRVIMAESNTVRLINLINELLEIEKMSAGKLKMQFSSIRIKPIIERAVLTAQVLAESKQISIIPDCPKDVEVFADPVRIEQVLMNLLSNAIRHAPAESSVTVSSNVHPEAVEVRVTDQGPGIPASAREKIFERFEQVASQDERGTSGLGLSICKMIVEEHGGSIGVDSEEGKGSSFWFRLPR